MARAKPCASEQAMNLALAEMYVQHRSESKAPHHCWPANPSDSLSFRSCLSVCIRIEQL